MNNNSKDRLIKGYNDLCDNTQPISNSTLELCKKRAEFSRKHKFGKIAVAACLALIIVPTTAYAASPKLQSAVYSLVHSTKIITPIINSSVTNSANKFLVGTETADNVADIYKYKLPADYSLGGNIATSNDTSNTKCYKIEKNTITPLTATIVNTTCTLNGKQITLNFRYLINNGTINLFNNVGAESNAKTFAYYAIGTSKVVMWDQKSGVYFVYNIATATVNNFFKDSALSTASISVVDLLQSPDQKQFLLCNRPVADDFNDKIVKFGNKIQVFDSEGNSNGKIDLSSVTEESSTNLIEAEFTSNNTISIICGKGKMMTSDFLVSVYSYNLDTKKTTCILNNIQNTIFSGSDNYNQLSSYLSLDGENTVHTENGQYIVTNAITGEQSAISGDAITKNLQTKSSDGSLQISASTTMEENYDGSKIAVITLGKDKKIISIGVIDVNKKKYSSFNLNGIVASGFTFGNWIDNNEIALNSSDTSNEFYVYDFK